VKKYVFITADIHLIGGMQNYVAAKTDYLRKLGWEIIILYNAPSKGVCKIDKLNDYLSGGFPELSISPIYFPEALRSKIINKMIGVIGKNNEIIIESHASSHAIWGEIIAKNLNAKHFCFICNEVFRGKGKYYEEHIGFFDYKHKRKELAGIKETSISRLFEGYKLVNPEENCVLVAANDGPVQDVYNPKIDMLIEADYTIAYIGRVTKKYFMPIIEGINDFSQSHKDKKIQFVIVGDATERLKDINSVFKKPNNIHLVMLGDCVPIPRNLYSRLDLVIAGSGCAICSAKEGIKTIIPDAQNYKANGVYGIDTFDFLYHEKNVVQTSFADAIERVLCTDFYKDKEIQIQNQIDPCIYYERHFEVINNSAQDKSYFDFTVKKYDIKNIVVVVKFYINKILPSSIKNILYRLKNR